MDDNFEAKKGFSKYVIAEAYTITGHQSYFGVGWPNGGDSTNFPPGTRCAFYSILKHSNHERGEATGNCASPRAGNQHVDDVVPDASRRRRVGAA